MRNTYDVWKFGTKNYYNSWFFQLKNLVKKPHFDRHKKNHLVNLDKSFCTCLPWLYGLFDQAYDGIID